MHCGIRALIFNGGGWKLCIPRQVIETLGWQRGRHIEFVVNPDDTVTMKQIARLPAKPAAGEPHP